MPQRSAFVLGIRPDRVDDYVAAHARVWPELLAALSAAGIRNYSIFLAGSQAFGYFECDDRARASDYLAGQDVSRRWQDEMAGLLEERVPDGGPPALPEIFRLD